jgi:hypothetical protein
MEERYWWVHHESEAIDFTYDHKEVCRMQDRDLVEPISVEEAEKLIKKGYVFDMKRLLE